MTEAIHHHHVVNVVVDPVMVATSRDRLLHDNAVPALQQELLPLATIVTPNIPEAEVLANIKVSVHDFIIVQPHSLSSSKIHDIESMETAAKVIGKLGPKYVLVKGGNYCAIKVTKFGSKALTNFFFQGI